MTLRTRSSWIAYPDRIGNNLLTCVQQGYRQAFFFVRHWRRSHPAALPVERWRVSPLTHKEIDPKQAAGPTSRLPAASNCARPDASTTFPTNPKNSGICARLVAQPLCPAPQVSPISPG
jgi:hypothetical protein